MNCRKFEEELLDQALAPAGPPSLAAAAHMKECPPCTSEYLAFQKTFRILDSWIVPEPTPYFDQKLAVRIREEQAAPRMGWFESLETRLRLNTGRSFRPVLASALALSLLIGGGSFIGRNTLRSTQSAQSSATINDLQILDRNEQAFQQLDELQQEEEGGSQSNEERMPAVPPVS